ncbi:MAG: two-component regulator propeller domain-containing protein [Flavobacteriaceae bacterium]
MSFKGLFRLVLLLCCFQNLLLWGQLTPPIENFLPEVFSGENQTWSITQASNDNIYFANHRYLLEFNGNHWNKYRTEGFEQMRKVFAHNERVYTGGYMTFGYWEKSPTGSLSYTSLIQELNIPILNGEEFWEIEFVDGLFVFQSLSRVYIVDLEKKTFDIIDSKTARPGLFLIDGTLYFVDTDRGLRYIRSGIIESIPNKDRLDVHDIVGSIVYRGETHFVVSSGEVYRLGDKGLERAPVALKTYAEIYSVSQSREGQIFLGTINQGLISLTPDLTTDYIINKKNGGINNTILSLFEDTEGNIWAGLDRGLTLINHQSSILEYNNRQNDIGSVYTSKVFNDRWYIGTNQGLFWTTLGGREKFELVEGTSGQVWHLDVVDGSLFCSHNKGVFEVTKDRAIWLGEQNGSWGVKAIATDQGETLLVSGSYDGLHIYHRPNTKWIKRNMLKGLSISSRFFEFFSKKVWIVNHEFLGVYIFEVDSDYRKITDLDHLQPYGNASNIFYFSDRLYYLTSKGVYLYQPQGKTFVYDSLMSSHVQPNRLKSSYLNAPFDNQLVLFSEEGLRHLRKHDLNQKLMVRQIYLPPSILQNLGNPGFENVQALSEGEYLVGLSDGFIVAQSTEGPTEQQKKASLNQIAVLGEDNQWNYISTNSSSSKLAPTQNTFKFTYSLAQFQKYAPVFFQTRLIGQNEQWSTWSTDATQEYYKLKPGDYTFELRYKQANSIYDVPTTFSFSIQQPWYLSRGMLFLYFSLIGITVYSIFRFANRYKSVRSRLNEEKQERIAQLKILREQNETSSLDNQNLRQELLQKKRELTFTYQSIIKNNTVMSRVKNELETIGHLDPKIQQTIALIKKSLNSQNDWRNFEKSFNELDNNFIFKLKSLHKDLTPQDIRLISYIRVNLDSKEIAELLNITLKSVEMKRYRLKKKLNLKQDEKLADYIFSIQ